MTFKESVESIATAIDAAGVLVIVGGIVIASARSIARVRGQGDQQATFRSYRHGIGRAILLGLEFLVAADIIRTIAVAPTFRGVGVLAIIILIRTFLSMTLELELEARWPWQRREMQRSPVPRSGDR